MLSVDTVILVWVDVLQNSSYLAVLWGVSSTPDLIEDGPVHLYI